MGQEPTGGSVVVTQSWEWSMGSLHITIGELGWLYANHLRAELPSNQQGGQ